MLKFHSNMSSFIILKRCSFQWRSLSLSILISMQIKRIRLFFRCCCCSYSHIFLNYGNVIGFRLKYLVVAYNCRSVWESKRWGGITVSQHHILPAIAHRCVAKQRANESANTNTNHKWKSCLCETIIASIYFFTPPFFLLWAAKYTRADFHFESLAQFKPSHLVCKTESNRT